ncbi:hypothetical protein K469DRAFT_745028 [Zopfia rhizophila CBS 207.26]|uniref:Uncharacterized protein n=1 Tax=Zopfia rhizophila CBS 207.26 TaxID=1314779 RepID=A0A6A6ERJ4_9PEZI|nr:hypothetical protein K469DRAFT_745028 [Zopfia rhizophila CBS 207.26]
MTRTRVAAVKSTGGDGPRKPIASKPTRKSAPSIDHPVNYWSSSEDSDNSSGEKDNAFNASSSGTDNTSVSGNSDRKRTHSSAEDEDDSDAPSRTKRARLENMPVFLRQEKEIEGLKNQVEVLQERIAQLHEYIDEKGLALVAPPSIRRDMLSRPNGIGIKALVKNIRDGMDTAFHKLENAIPNSRKTGITSDDLCSALAPFLDEINKIRKMNGEDNLKFAYELVLELADHSTYEWETGYGFRPTDAPADELRERIAVSRRKRGEEWNYMEELREMETDQFEFSSCIKWFPRTIKLFLEWVKEDGLDYKSPIPELEEAQRKRFAAIRK